MAETVDELTVTYEDGGIETVKELDKKVLTKGAWATVIFRYQDWNRAKNEYGPDKYTIRRYQKQNGEYKLIIFPTVDDRAKKYSDDLICELELCFDQICA